MGQIKNIKLHIVTDIKRRTKLKKFFFKVKVKSIFTMSNIFNQQFDPEDETENEFSGKMLQNKIHIRIQQRNGRKTISTVQGIEEKYDLKKLAKAFKKEFNCNGTVVEDEQYGEVIQLSGDQRNNVQQFLVDTSICKKDNIVVHGF